MAQPPLNAHAEEIEQTPLERAVASDQLDAVDDLIKRDGLNRKFEIHKTQLRKLLALSQSKEVASLLIQYGADISSRGDGESTVLMEVSAIPVMRVLLSRDVDVEETDCEGRTALRRTVELDNDQEKARFLIEDVNADINASDNAGRSVLMTAVWKSRRRVLESLLSRKEIKASALDHKGRIALHHLAADPARIYSYQPDARPGQQQATDQDILNKLLLAGNQPNAKDNKGRTCLHWAAATGCNGVLQVFLQTGKFDVNELESVSKTPLHLAAEEGRSKCVEALLGKQAMADVEDDGAWTPLHYACEAPNDVSSSVEQLLGHGAEINRRTRHGTTPLHLAAGAGNLEIVRTLLHYDGIRRNSRDMFGNTPLLRAASLPASNPKRKKIIKLFAPWQTFNTLSPAAEHAAKLWNATIVDFNANVDDHRQQSTTAKRLDPISIFDLLYARNHDDTGPAESVKPLGLGQGGFRWVHLPANCTEWCQDLFTKYYVEERTMNVNSFKALERSFNQQQGGTKPQSRYMSSTCQSVLRPWGNEDGAIPMGDTEYTVARSATFSDFRKQDGPEVEKEERQQNSAQNFNRPVGRSFTLDSNGSSVEDKEGQVASNDFQESTPPTLQPTSQIDSRKTVTISERTDTIESMGSSNNGRDARNLPSSPLAIHTNMNDAAITDFYIFMPFLNYEIFEKHEHMHKYLEEFSKAGTHSECLQLAPERHANERDLALFRAHLTSREHPLHVRRTLDQSFYHHIDTTERDSGQVIHRFQTGILGFGKDKSKILMVDQLWMWVIGESLIVTSFPVRWEQPRNDPLNLLEYVMSIIDLGTREPVRSIYELAMIITGRCYGAYDRHGTGSEDYHFLDMYEGWIGAAMDDEVKLFKFFKQDSENASQWLRDPHPLREAKRRLLKRQKKKKKKANEIENENANQSSKQQRRETTFKVIRMDREGDFQSTEETFVENLLDIGWETTLLQEVKDIRDELGMVSLIFDRQQQVRKGFEDVINSIIEQNAEKRLEKLLKQKVAKAFEDHLKTITQPSRDTERMKSQARGVYDSVCDLLDLKQKHANAIEARYAREQTDGTSRQGKTLTVFTIVTTIFLPISFIAAVFAINMNDLPGAPRQDSSGKQQLSFAYVAKWTFMPGLLFAAICVVVGLCWEDIWYWLKEMYGKWKHSRNASKGDNRTTSLNLDKGHLKTPKRLPAPPLSTAGSTARSVGFQNAFSNVRTSISRRARPRDEESGASGSQSTMVNGSV